MGSDLEKVSRFLNLRAEMYRLTCMLRELSAIVLDTISILKKFIITNHTTITFKNSTYLI